METEHGLRLFGTGMTKAPDNGKSLAYPTAPWFYSTNPHARFERGAQETGLLPGKYRA